MIRRTPQPNLFPYTTLFRSGPRRDVTVMNAGAGIYAAEAAESMAEGVALAKAAIDSGRAMERLERLVALTRELGAEADRKSTRLNSSHGYISYAGFCLKKKL